MVRACKLGHANEAIHHVLSPEVFHANPGAREHIS